MRRPTKHLSIHYYVLSLSEQTSMFYEGFRDQLIEIQDNHFPFKLSVNMDNPSSTDTQLTEFFRRTDQHFAYFYKQDPLRLVVVGEKINLAIFKASKIRQNTVIGTVEGNFSNTTPYDLGKIVWPVVRQAIAGMNQNAMSDLARASKVKKVVSGIHAVGQDVGKEAGSTLYVEEDYHVKGSFRKTDHSLILSPHVDIWEVIDDVVDVIIEKVLQMGGTVIFLNSGLLKKFERIALILRS